MKLSLLFVGSPVIDVLPKEDVESKEVTSTALEEEEGDFIGSSGNAFDLHEICQLQWGDSNIDICSYHIAGKRRPPVVLILPMTL
jgi:hypothetical protein